MASRSEDLTVPMAVSDDNSVPYTIPVDEDISDGRPKPIVFEKTQQANTIRLVVHDVDPSRASGEIMVKNIMNRSVDDEMYTVEVDGIIELDPKQRLYVLQSMLEAIHLDYDFQPSKETPIGEAVEYDNERSKGVKLVVFYLKVLRVWLLSEQQNDFASIRPLIDVVLRPSALWFLRHVTKVLQEYQSPDPDKLTILEISPS